MSGARNDGLASAEGEWTTFCDDDDVWAPDKLCQQLDAVTAADHVWVYAGAVYVDDVLRPVRPWPWVEPAMVAESLRQGSAVPAGASNVMVRTDVLRGVGGFDEAFRHCADWALWFELAGIGVPAAVERPLVGYRRHANNDSRQTRSLVREIPLLAERGDIDPAVFLRWAAGIDLEAGRFGSAATLLLRAARHDATPSRLGKDARGFAWHVRRVVTGYEPERGMSRASRAMLAAADEWLRPLRESQR
jgi:glycosyltransferase involved in cell wall biosynthesis